MFSTIIEFCHLYLIKIEYQLSSNKSTIFINISPFNMPHAIKFQKIIIRYPLSLIPNLKKCIIAFKRKSFYPIIANRSLPREGHLQNSLSVSLSPLKKQEHLSSNHFNRVTKKKQNVTERTKAAQGCWAQLSPS